MVNALGAGGATSIVLREGFPDQERDAVARMYWAAFGSKLGFALRPDDAAVAMLAEVVNADSAIAAHSIDGHLLGVAGYKTADASFVPITFESLRRHYGTFGAIWRGTVLSALERSAEAGTLLMDGIFVTAQARGAGVGAALLDAIKRKAREKGCARVRLDVIDTNPRARQLYERKGFRAAGVRHLGPLRFLFGFRYATTMLAETDAAI